MDDAVDAANTAAAGPDGTPKTAPPADVNHTFSDAELDQLAAYGEVRRHAAGTVLVAPGDREADMLVTLSGETHIFVDGPAESRRVGYMERGQFAGDIAVLTGGAALARTVMGVEGEVLHIPYPAFRRLLVENSRFSDAFVRTLAARRAFALSRANAAMILIGGALDRSAHALRTFLSRNSTPFSWLDPDEDALATTLMEAHGLDREALPAVILSAAQVVTRATPDDIARALGLDALSDGAEADVVVVGAGPAGLAACVYAGSEGLSVIALDAEAPGGQAGSSSKIENYLGFPMGVSGRELAERAAVQAQKFGVRMAAPARAAALEFLEDGRYCVRTRDGRAVSARAVVLAMGAQYRRLAVDGVERFEGAGVFYGASPVEAQICARARVTVVGAGNSAGQGAMFLSETAHEVHVLYRRADIRETMSEYLVRRLEETPNVHLHPQTEIAALHACSDGAERLGAITVTGPEGETRLETPFVFLFIGAAPMTDWLPGEIARDRTGFLKTGQALGHLDLVKARWSLDRMPSAYETSLPRVYAVGDVRAGSVKRVASSVGEGSVTVSDVHRAILEVPAV